MNCQWSEVQLSVVGLAVNACAHGDQAGSQAPGMLLWFIKIPDETRAQTDEDARVSCRATDDAQGTACGKQTLGERT